MDSHSCRLLCGILEAASYKGGCESHQIIPDVQKRKLNTETSLKMFARDKQCLFNIYHSPGMIINILYELYQV